MSNTYTTIRTALIKALHGLSPNSDILGEPIAKTNSADPTAATEDYYYIDIIPAGNTSVGAYLTLRTVLVDIAAHLASESHKEYLVLSDKIDKLFRPAFSFGDRAITVNDSSSRVVDNVLHYTFTISCYDTTATEPELPYMETLNTVISDERT